MSDICPTHTLMKPRRAGRGINRSGAVGWASLDRRSECEWLRYITVASTGEEPESREFQGLGSRRHRTRLHTDDLPSASRSAAANALENIALPWWNSSTGIVQDGHTRLLKEEGMEAKRRAGHTSGAGCPVRHLPLCLPSSTAEVLSDEAVDAEKHPFSLHCCATIRDLHVSQALAAPSPPVHTLP